MHRGPGSSVIHTYCEVFVFWRYIIIREWKRSNQRRRLSTPMELCFATETHDVCGRTTHCWNWRYINRTARQTNTVNLLICNIYIIIYIYICVCLCDCVCACVCVCGLACVYILMGREDIKEREEWRVRNSVGETGGAGDG